MQGIHSEAYKRDRPLISIVLPAYNRAELIPRAIKSVFSQEWSYWELIVVDDGSTDHTQDVVSEYGDPRVKYVRHRTNRGAAAARNTGIEVAQGEYLAFLDSDDEWLPARLDVMLDVIRKADEEVGLAYCRAAYVDDERDVMLLPDMELPEGNVFEDLLRGWCPPITSSILVRRESVVEVGGYDEELPSFHDFDLWLRLASRLEFVVVDEPLVVLHRHRDSRLTTDPASRREGLRVFLEKWSPVITSSVGESAAAGLRRHHMSRIYWLESLQHLRNSQRGKAVQSFKRYISGGLHNVALKRVVGFFAALVGGVWLYDTLLEAWRRVAWRSCNGQDPVEYVSKL